MPPARGAAKGSGGGGGGCPFHHLHKNLAALQEQGGGLLASQPPLVWAAVAAVGTLVLAYLVYRLVLALFAKRYKVPAKGGAVVITGASTGIGNHAALALAERGFVVYATVRKQADVDALNKLGAPTLRPIIMDVAKPAEVEAAAKKVLAELKAQNLPLVGLINNAGVAQKFPLEFHPLKDLRAMFDVHLFGPLDLTQRLLPELRKNQGRIINLSSITALVVLPTGSAYGGSKLAQEAISDGLRRELADFGVSVSIIQPAFVSTAIFGKVTQSIDQEVEMSKEIMDVYGYFFRPEKRRKDRKQVERASPPTVTTDAITHALTSPYPKTRYIVANVNGVPAWVLGWLVWACPDRVADFIMKRFS